MKYSIHTDCPNPKVLTAYDNAAIFPQFRCTLSCPDCSAKAARHTEPMTLAQITRFYERLIEQSGQVKHLRISGGEPTMWPDLKEAISLAKRMGAARKVIVFSNGLNRRGEDYGEADLVRVTHYGALNRRSIYQLKKDLARRLRVSWTVHIPYDRPNIDAVGDLPAKCGSMGMCLAGGKVYPCCYRAINGIDGYDIESNFYALCCNSRANEQEICRKCWGNPSLFKTRAVPLTFEWGIWESPFGQFISLPWKMVWLRRLLAKRYVRRVFAGK